ncbi:MAG: protein kinase [Pirellula sp.]|nr:protein kinase [Pirellula sp.]
MNVNAKQSIADSQTLELAPTSLLDPTTEISAEQVFDDSRRDETRRQFQVGVVENRKTPRFSEETSKLLRSRLQYAALDIWVVLTISFVGNLLASNHEWLILRTVVLVSALVSYLLLRGTRPFSPLGLRLFELTLFGGLALQLGLMMTSRLIYFASLNDAVSVASTKYLYFTAFCLHVLTYSIFMPNTWKRAAVVTTLIAIVPYAIWYFVIATNPSVLTLANQNKAVAPIPVTLIAALIGTFGSHIINRARREAFQAKQLLQYRLLDRLGEGGMGEVYRAEHILLKRPCAIKLIQPGKANDQHTIDRFEKEVVATAKLSHWNTIDIYDYGRTPDGTFFYVMELLEGMNLQELIYQYGPMDQGRVVYLLLQACLALNEAHESGMIHRDIKPANLFVTKRGGFWDVLKVLDFGLVKETSDDATNREKGAFCGTPGFMAPEQAFRYDQVDARSDIYALGAVAYFLLSGRPIFSKSNVIELIAAHANDPVPSLATIVPTISPKLEQIVLRCLKKFPEERYASTIDLYEDLMTTGLHENWDATKAKSWWSERSP